MNNLVEEYADSALPLSDGLDAIDGWTVHIHGSTARIAHDPSGSHSLDAILNHLHDALLSGLTVTVSEGGVP